MIFIISMSDKQEISTLSNSGNYDIKSDADCVIKRGVNTQKIQNIS